MEELSCTSNNWKWSQKNKPYKMNNKSLQELELQLKNSKIVVGAQLGILTVLLGVSIYGILVFDTKTIFVALLVVGISIVAMLPSQFSTIKKIKTALELKKSAQV